MWLLLLPHHSVGQNFSLVCQCIYTGPSIQQWWPLNDVEVLPQYSFLLYLHVTFDPISR